MKKLLSLLLVSVMILSLAACGGNGAVNSKLENTAGYVKGEVEGGDYSAELNEPYYDKNGRYNPTVLGIFYRNVIGADITADDDVTTEINGKADEMLKKIEDFPDSIKAAEGAKTYYVSAEGNDSNDGLTPKTPKKTYMSFKGQLNEGDAVLFRRGDVFRGQMVLVSGVSYGAYGSGIKPRIYGSISGTEGEWKDEGDGIYTYSKAVQCCNIIFDHGREMSRPVYSKSDLKDSPYNAYFSGSRITLYSPEGNPGEIFDSIEIADDYYVIWADGSTKNVKLQNLAVMYTGQASRGAAENFEVEGCIFGYAGGTRLYTRNNAISIGNGIDFVQKARNINIHDTYIFQAFDAGITHQGPFDTASDNLKYGADYGNIHYENNLIEFCTYGIEVFSMRNKTAQSKYPDYFWGYDDTYITGNIIRYSGYGWGSMDRPDKNVYADFKYDAEGEENTNLHRKPLIIENNILYGTRKRVFSIQSPESNKANMIMKNNLIVTNKNAVIYKSIKATGDFESKLKQFFTYENNTFKVIN